MSQHKIFCDEIAKALQYLTHQIISVEEKNSD